MRILLFMVSLSLPYGLFAKQNNYQQALTYMEDLLGLDGSSVQQVIQGWQALEQKPDPTKRFLFKGLRSQSWGSKISEFLAFAQLLYSFQDPWFQNINRTAFEDAHSSLGRLRTDVNGFLKEHHPGFILGHENIAPLSRSITIGVFDVFDANQLQAQRMHYHSAVIEEVKSFGDPVSLNHGNSVIDIILTMVPEARIVPISSDARHYHQAFNYIRGRDDVLLVNMSRAFAEREGRIDPDFEMALINVLKQKIVVKSLGNSGTDLAGNPSPENERQGLTPSPGLFSYDLELIHDFLDGYDGGSMIFAINLDLLAEAPALTATVPGGHSKCQGMSLAAPADGIFSFSTGNFEQGSSFAAPQITAFLALLLSHSPDKSVSEIVLATKKSARTLDFASSEIGMGIPSGKQAVFYLNQTF